MRNEASGKLDCHVGLFLAQHLAVHPFFIKVPQYYVHYLLQC